MRIVEQKDGKLEELKVKEINTGVFCFDNQDLWAALKQVGNDNSQGEYYLTDVWKFYARPARRSGLTRCRTSAKAWG